MEMNRIIRLKGLSHFAAPYGVKVNPAPILPGEECIEIITGGRIYFDVNGSEQEFGIGSIFWHVGGEETIHRTPPDDPYRCLAMRFYVAEDCRVLPRVTCWKDLNALGDFCRQAFRYAHDERIDNLVLGTMLYSRVFWEAYIGLKKEEDADYPPPLNRAIAVLNRDYAEALSIDLVSRRAGISTPNLYNLFKRHLKITPHQYLLNLRLRCARTMLAGNEKSIKEISQESGFENIESFYRAFRKNCQMTPAEYRRVNIVSDAEKLNARSAAPRWKSVSPPDSHSPAPPCGSC
jgi:AraC-like DNA-binding protein